MCSVWEFSFGAGFWDLGIRIVYDWLFHTSPFFTPTSPFFISQLINKTKKQRGDKNDAYG